MSLSQNALRKTTLRQIYISLYDMHMMKMQCVLTYKMIRWQNTTSSISGEERISRKKLNFLYLVRPEEQHNYALKDFE